MTCVGTIKDWFSKQFSILLSDFFVAAIAVASFPGALVAQPQELREKEGNRELLRRQAMMIEEHSSSSQPLCGIYATSRALDLIGVTCDPAEFATTRYVSSLSGSTPDDLIRMVEVTGAKATPLMFLSKLELELLGAPVIANVRSMPSAPTQDHWICVLPERQGLTAFDGPYQGKPTDPAEFLALWNGFGLVVGPSNWNPIPLIWGVRILAVSILFSPAIVLLFHSLRNRSSMGQVSLTRQFFYLLAAVCAVALMGQYLFGDFQNHRRGIRTAMLPWFPKVRHSASLDEFLSLTRKSNCLILDSRFKEDFAFGSVGGAINIPFHLPIVELERCFKGIPREEMVVLFCQSGKCSYSKFLAEKLEQIGFTNLTVSEIGINELREANLIDGSSPKRNLPE